MFFLKGSIFEEPFNFLSSFDHYRRSLISKRMFSIVNSVKSRNIKITVS